jgi:energy-coupling factor transporter ATP-binding protein EcfA2
MAAREYVASIQRDKGRSSYCVIFRHPLKAKRDGTKGRRVRRGLDTTDEKKAQELADQLNTILNDPSYYNLASREKALKEFDARVVAAFYDNLTPVLRDSWAERNSRILFPGPKEGYARVLLVGTTGAGKTTLVRQLIGSDPDKERFPSIAPAKTTISDIEIITADGPFKAVVTFIQQEFVHKYIEECVAASAIGYFETGLDNDLIRRFLVHTEQRFRLSYLLGSLKSQTSEETDLDDEDEIIEDISSQLTAEERELLLKNLLSYIARIKQLVSALQDDAVKLAAEFKVDLHSSPKEEIDFIYEYLEEQLYDYDAFHELVDDITSDVESRFEYLTEGEITRNKNGWPSSWYYESDSREDFIRLINTFSSNYAPKFGRLLTPLVDGIRVIGDFSAPWADKKMKIALMDGEGLGHTPDSSASVSTNITRKFQDAEAIVIVDNAEQPMLDPPLTVLNSLVSRGYESKLVVCFTHFDQIKGVNLPSFEERKNHILSSVDNTIVAIGNKLDVGITRSLRRLLSERVVFLSGINKTLSEGSKRTRHELNRLINIFESLTLPVEPIHTIPIYDDANLVLSIQRSVQQFHENWRARLKLQYHPSIQPEHWSRIKALTRRLGELGINEYDTLRPVADLIQNLLNGFNNFISRPLKWEPMNPNEDMQQQAKAKIKQELDLRIDRYISQSLHIDRMSEWFEAYTPRGSGSTLKRARIVQEIYDNVSPIPGEIPSADLNRFLKELRLIVKESIEAAGGKISMV